MRGLLFVQATIIMLMSPSSPHPTYASFQSRFENLKKEEKPVYSNRFCSTLGIGPSRYTIDAAPASIAIWTETLFIKSVAMDLGALRPVLHTQLNTIKQEPV